MTSPSKKIVFVLRLTINVLAWKLFHVEDVK